MNIEVINTDGKKVSTVTVSETLFDGKVNKGLIYEAVRMQMATRRSGNASTKTRAEVRGSGAKPWRQKGTGRARFGSKRNPIWRSGGIAHGPRPRDYSYNMPKKAVKGALRSALQYKLNEGKVKLFDNLEIAEAKTRVVVAAMNNIEVGNALFITSEANHNLNLATRNIKGVKYLELKAVNVYDVLKYDTLLMTKEAFEKVEQMLG